VSLLHESKEMLLFSEEIQRKFVKFLKKVLLEGIEKGELKDGIERYADTMMVFATGLVVDSCLSIYEIEKEIRDFLELLFLFKQEKSI